MIYNLIISSVFCVGLNICIDNLLDHFTGKSTTYYYNRIKNKLWKVISKPLWYCATCHASIWGVATYYFLSPEFVIYECVIHCISLAFLNSFLNQYV